MASRQWTTKMVWDAAVEDYRKAGQVPYESDRFELVHRAGSVVLGEFYPLWVNDMMRDIVLTPNSSGIIDVSSLAIMPGYEGKLILRSEVGGSLGSVAGTKTVSPGVENHITWPTALTNNDYLIFGVCLHPVFGNVGFSKQNLTPSGFDVVNVSIPIGETATLYWFVYQLGQGTAAGRQSLAQGSNIVPFGLTITEPYVVLVNNQANGIDVGYNIADRDNHQMTIDVQDDSELEFLCIETTANLPNGLILNAIHQSILAGGQPFVLTTPMPSADYPLLPPRLANAAMDIGFSITGKDENGFTVTPVPPIAGTFEAIAIQVGQLSGSSTFQSYPFDPLHFEDLLLWRPNARQNKYRMVFTHKGQSIHCRRGFGHTQWNTITVSYPGVYTRPTSDATKCDIPDGAGIEVLISALRTMLAMRTEKDTKEYVKEIAKVSQSLYSGLGVTLRNEDIQKKWERLLI